MIRLFQIIVILIFIFLLARLIRLFRQYISSNRTTINDLKDRGKRLGINYRDIEEADFREVPPGNGKDDNKEFNLDQPEK